MVLGLDGSMGVAGLLILCGFVVGVDGSIGEGGGACMLILCRLIDWSVDPSIHRHRHHDNRRKFMLERLLFDSVFSVISAVHGGKTYGELAQNHWAEIDDMVVRRASG